MDRVMLTDMGDALPSYRHYSPLSLIHVEVCQKSSSTARTEIVKQHVSDLLYKYKNVYGDAKLTEFDDSFLTEHVNYVAIVDTDLHQEGKKVIDLCNVKTVIQVFQLYVDGPATEEIEDENMPAANHYLLPASEFDGLWESLIFDENIKSRLLQYAMSTLHFADRKVDTNVISWNKVVLLHGPPGTGKTSLCKALAQKLCIRMSDRYNIGQLIEVNSHSLFSKWFSESGKLVMKMFQKIQELIDDPNALVCVLIDEIESLTSARKNAMSGSEPSDAIRVVNALLTQLDHIKRFPNVIILTTSNITGAIDLAFVDRADIKQYIGPPSAAAIFQIYHSCISELMRTGIIAPTQQLLDLRALEVTRYVENEATRPSLQLRNIAIKSVGLSGRTLRKLPFIAHAIHIGTEHANLDEFLIALSAAVEQQFCEQNDLFKE